MAGSWLPTEVAIRPVRLPEERDLFAGLSVATFSSSAPWEATRAFWGDYITGLPYFRPGHWLGAFRGGDYVGGVAVYQRVMRVGLARVLVGCIASLTVRSDQRGLGIGKALLRAAECASVDRGDAITLLHGVPNLYRKLGYSDVQDSGYIRVSRPSLASLDLRAAAQIRDACADDAPAFLALFEAHFGGHTGAFDRDLALQRYFLDARIRDACPVVTCNPDGRITGYAIFNWSRKRWKVDEAVAEDWPAAFALLAYVQRRQADLGLGDQDVRLPCPSDSTLAFALADNVWTTHETEHDADAGWMAKPLDAGRLVAALAPEIDRRIRSAGLAAAAVGLVIDGAQTLRIGSAGRCGQAPARTAHLSGGALVQMLFGHRPIAWLAGQPGCSLQSTDIDLLGTLFPPTGAWIAGTDAF